MGRHVKGGVPMTRAIESPSSPVVPTGNWWQYTDGRRAFEYVDQDGQVWIWITPDNFHGDWRRAETRPRSRRNRDGERPAGALAIFEPARAPLTPIEQAYAAMAAEEA